MLTQNNDNSKLAVKVLGIHNGIQLIQKVDKTEWYYSTKTGKCAMGIKGIARMIGCHPQTVENQGVKLGLGKDLEMYTVSGLQGVKLIMEDELNDLFEGIKNSKCKQTTKDSVTKIQGKYVQAGFRLQVLLEVAPHLVAKEAISRISDPTKAKEVAVAASTQVEYLESFHRLGDAIKSTGASYGAIHGHNNKLVKIPNGKRPLATDNQKVLLSMVQSIEKLKLEANQNKYRSGSEATNSAKKAGSELVSAIVGIIGD